MLLSKVIRPTAARLRGRLGHGYGTLLTVTAGERSARRRSRGWQRNPELMIESTISGAIVKSHSANSSEVEREVGAWLRNSTDRNSGRKKRQKEKQRVAEEPRADD